MGSQVKIRARDAARIFLLILVDGVASIGGATIVMWLALRRPRTS